MAIQSSTPAWKIPWTEEPDRLQSMRSQRVKTQLSNFTFTSVYIFFSTGQVLLSALSWCSECTSVSEGVFLMYLWGEMYSTSTYSSPILFSLLFQLLISKFLSILSLRFSYKTCILPSKASAITWNGPHMLSPTQT